jgi:CRISPR/Cas system-associated exonuclease Cas4 (RecB family)
MRLSVSDIRDYFWCPRSLWLKANGVMMRNVDYCVGGQFHALIHGVINMIFSIYKQQLSGRMVAWK